MHTLCWNVLKETSAWIFIDLFCVVFPQRKNTLLKEYKQKDKANKFIDRRFGEYDTKMAPEDKILQRFSLERQVSSLFNVVLICNFKNARFAAP